MDNIEPIQTKNYIGNIKSHSLHVDITYRKDGIYVSICEDGYLDDEFKLKMSEEEFMERLQKMGAVLSEVFYKEFKPKITPNRICKITVINGFKMVSKEDFDNLPTMDHWKVLDKYYSSYLKFKSSCIPMKKVVKVCLGARYLYMRKQKIRKNTGEQGDV